ncbi:uncharacterized protein [Anabrus simplex]|uniref:uncharacterized protein n=1 Tax=Anabrus simplex TaxID=316456 RepID=UPI0035A36B0C
MDQEVKIKEEPAWPEGTTNASLENIEHVSEMIPLKNEAKSELTEPVPMQENSFEPSKDIKEEVFIEEHTDDQLLPNIKEETNSDLLHFTSGCFVGIPTSKKLVVLLFLTPYCNTS